MTSDKLIGHTYSGKKIVATQSLVVDPAKQVTLKDWVSAQLPPPNSLAGQPGQTDRAEDDASYWDWVWTESSDGPPIALLGLPGV